MATNIAQPVVLTSALLLESKGRPRRKENLDALTGLRFFAALGVVMYHFARPALPRWSYPLSNVIGSGYVAVSFFFLLSGFILSYSYLDGKGTMRGNRRSFYASRLARIYPAYLLAFVLAAPMNIIWSLRVNHAAVATFKLITGALLVLTFQQSWTPWTAWYWNFPAWSVSVEVFFYLTFPWIGPRLAGFRLSSCIKAALGLWLLSLCAPACLYMIKGTTGAPELNDHLQMVIEFNPIFCLPEFLIGILLGRAYKLGFVFSWSSQTLSYLATACIFSILAFCPSIPHPLLANGLLIPFFSILIYALAQGRGLLVHALSQPLLVLLGEASYGIYILQIPIAYVLKIPPPHHSLRTFFIYLFVLVSVSLFSWRCVESPLRVRLRRWLAGD